MPCLLEDPDSLNSGERRNTTQAGLNYGSGDVTKRGTCPQGRAGIGFACPANQSFDSALL